MSALPLKADSTRLTCPLYANSGHRAVYAATRLINVGSSIFDALIHGLPSSRQRDERQRLGTWFPA